MSGKLPEDRCDFCYARAVNWKFKAQGIRGDNFFHFWQFNLCESCTVLLKDIVGPVLHKMSHMDFVTALVRMMAACEITYEDLMKPLLELNQLEEHKQTEATRDEEMKSSSDHSKH